MNAQPLPHADEMYQALLARDASYDGIFFVGVRSTGIFCRPVCPARKPMRRNVDFYATARDALAHGFRPCKRCRPLQPQGETPPPIQRLIEEVEADPSLRLRDGDLRARGVEPATARRWFKRHHGMTFHAYQRARRLANALGALAQGDAVTHAAFDSGFDSISGFQEAMRRITGRSPSASRDAVVVQLSRVLTPLGPMLMGTTEHGVALLEFTDRRMLGTQLQRLARRLRCVFVPGRSAVGRRMEEELALYFAGTLHCFNTPLQPAGTEFQQRVWQVLKSIPYGETRSYGDQARLLGMPSAVRAVARANGDNPLAIVVPCHRVIGADGKLTGYGGGLWRKRWLLHHEVEQGASRRSEQPGQQSLPG
ncbi:MAG TPA: methylated-DNA--[protein]-cysteine S-methyltransferase [Gammaproteobacteria bacterium]|nr:methylated-DNA--[protein]-cysteine S-methyltransferase [Gammaproteobacteria bacterium]